VTNAKRKWTGVIKRHSAMVLPRSYLNWGCKIKYVISYIYFIMIKHTVSWRCQSFAHCS